MTTSPRVYLSDFALANPVYAGAQVRVLVADTTTWRATTTLATLYSALTGTAEEANPITLDGDGKLLRPVYVDRPVVCRVTGGTAPAHETGITGVRRGAVQSDWAEDTYYVDGDVVRDGAAGEDTGSLYVSQLPHTSGASFADDLAAEKWAILVDMDALAREAAALVSTVYVGTIGLTEPAANAVFQRDTRTGGLWSKGVGTVPLTINPTQPVTLLEYRLRNAASLGSVLQDWATAAPPIQAGSQTIEVSAPAGLYKYIIDLRAHGDDTSIVSTTNAVMVGEVRAFAGQSLAEDFITTVANGDATTIAGLGLTVSPWAWLWCSYGTNNGAYPAIPDFETEYYPPAAWLQPSDSGPFDSSWAVEYTNRLITLTGVPCALVGYAVGGTGIDTWLPGYAGTGTAHWDTLVDVVTLAGGKFGGFLWCQGHYESKNGNTASAYRAQLELLFTEIEDAFPDAAGFFRIICTIPGIGSYGSGVSFVNMVRATAKAYVEDTANTYYVDGLDATLMPDLVHPSQAGNILFARQWYRADALAMGLATPGNDGPVMLSADRAYGSQDFVITCSNPNGATAWVEVGSSVNQFTIYPEGTTSGALTLTAIDLTSFPDITITTSSSITEPAGFDIWYRRSPDTSGIIAAGIYDDADADGLPTGRQLALSGEALNCAMPVVTLTVASISNNTAGTSTTISGTYTNGTPTGIDYSLDGGASWTSATSPTIAAGAYSFTLASGFPVGIYRLKLRDAYTYGSVTSNQFSITMASPPTLPTIASQIFAMDMSVPSSHVFTDTNRTIQAAMGDTVAGVSDLSGTSNHFLQATTTKRPTILPNIKNGLPGLRFTGSLSQFLNVVSGAPLATTLKASTGYTMFLVFTPATLPDAGQAAATVLAVSEKAKIGGFNIIRGAQYLTATTLRASRNADAALYQPTVASAVADNQLTKVVTRYNGGANTLKIKANALTEGSVSTAGLGTNAFTAAYIGAEGSNGIDQFFFDGYVHEIRIWNTAGSDTNRDDLLTYALSKWAS